MTPRLRSFLALLFQAPVNTWQHHVCRLVAKSTDRLYVGTAVLISDQGKQFGYALTCWHNFDETGRRKIDSDGRLTDAWLISNAADINDERARRPVIVVNNW